MSLSDFGSWASIFGLVIALIAFFVGYKIVRNFKNTTKQENKLFSLYNSGKISQKNNHSQKKE
ncbi:hypothetical protein JX580_08980 [Thiomicrospira microaerophila]|uniref:FeoB-associated Cys-rich membrane protein n=1 Tax=Thiomicrospira microaerophila TaxID=406020 RepID=UPI00200D8F77|nr:FeoB-associated Cys-rich membrane protein [Thiomicrospira microaerophila]UQB41796.1 hypothetical protein JX580_08980 [Thiomicrospira microaerophila]